MKVERTYNIKRILKKSEDRHFTQYDFNIYYKATVIMKPLYWHKDWQIDQGSRMKSPGIDIESRGYLIFDKSDKLI